MQADTGKQRGDRADGTIGIGDPVLDVAGEKVGEVSRIIVDARTDTISGLVVKADGWFGKERIIPRDLLDPSADGLRSEIPADDFEDLSPYDASAFHSPDPDYSGPPGFDRESLGQANLTLDTAVAMGSLAGIGTSAKPMGFPGGETRAPEDQVAAAQRQLPVVERGADILDARGRKVGEVDEIAFDGSGHASSLTAKQGFIFAKRFDIPAEWIEDISDQGVILNVAEDRLQAVVGG